MPAAVGFDPEKSGGEPGESLRRPLRGGVAITPIAFLIIKGEQVRMMPIAVPANSTADRIVEQLPELLDKLGDFLDGRKKPQEPAE